jgi:hypothetical protein
MLWRVVLTTLAVVLLGAGDARAQLLVPPAHDCPEEIFEQPFGDWSDNGRYVRLPDGGFEDGAAAWELRGARLVAGTRGMQALALPPGAWAKSPTFCVGLMHPTIRFFARNTGSPLGLLAASAIVKTTLGLTVEIPLGVAVNASDAWAPSLPMPLIVNLLTLTGGQTRIAVRFTAIGPQSSWEIDDVYVDPYGKR